MKFEYEVLLRVDTDKENGFTLSELCSAFPDHKKRDIAKAIGEMEVIGAIRGFWKLNETIHRWERRYFTAGEGTPDFIKTLLEYKEMMFKES